MKSKKLSLKSCYICDSLKSLEGEDREELLRQFEKYHRHAKRGDKK